MDLTTRMEIATVTVKVKDLVKAKDLERVRGWLTDFGSDSGREKRTERGRRMDSVRDSTTGSETG